MGYSPEQIDAAIRSAIPEAMRGSMGFGGQCAAFAVVLDRVLGGDNIFVCADGGHYEFVEHVALRHDGRLYDASGLIDEDRLRDWADPDDGEEAELIEIDAAQDVRRLVDSTGGGLVGPIDEDALETRLRHALPTALHPR